MDEQQPYHAFPGTSNPNLKRNELNEFEYFLKNHFAHCTLRLRREAKLQFFQRPLREDAIEYFEKIHSDIETTLDSV